MLVFRSLFLLPFAPFYQICSEVSLKEQVLCCMPKSSHDIKGFLPKGFISVINRNWHHSVALYSTLSKRIICSWSLPLSGNACKHAFYSKLNSFTNYSYQRSFPCCLYIEDFHNSLPSCHTVGTKILKIRGSPYYLMWVKQNFSFSLICKVKT